MTDINIGQFSEALNDKMDRDAHNVQSPSAVVIEKQDPTSANNYTWYRKYSDGWVEQGGFATSSQSGTTCNLPITMANNKYTAQVTVVDDGASNYSTTANSRTTTYIKISNYAEARPCSWFVCGMAA